MSAISPAVADPGLRLEESRIPGLIPRRAALRTLGKSSLAGVSESRSNQAERATTKKLANRREIPSVRGVLYKRTMNSLPRRIISAGLFPEKPVRPIRRSFEESNSYAANWVQGQVSCVERLFILCFQFHAALIRTGKPSPECSFSRTGPKHGRLLGMIQRELIALAR